MIKKYLKAVILFSLILSIVFISIVFAMSLLGNKTSKTNSSSLSNSTSTNNKTLPSSTYSLSEVAKHNLASDCWMIINDKVYNVTNYLNDHPGGPDTMVAYCGKDATEAFNTKDRAVPKPHSQEAVSLLDQFFVGNLSK